MHDEIHAGATLTISAPKNHFPLADAPRSLLLAGGIGVTPILAMAERCPRAARSSRCTTARAPERTAFRERILNSPFAAQVHFHHDSAQKLDLPALLAGLERDTHIYFCGPPGFIDARAGHGRRAGLAGEPAAPRILRRGRSHDATEGDQPFEVKLASSGKVLHHPADSTVLRVLTDAGVFIPASCEQGVCGTCLTRVLDGVPEHRDLYLTEAEQAANDQFTPCCSRSRSATLLLDL
jgi:vanillate O-demethylase ferredoxin subunit